jgi:hypothetical protein
MLLSKALKMQQDYEDKKNETIIEGLENKIKDFEASLKKKDFLMLAFLPGPLVFLYKCCTNHSIGSNHI